MVNPRLMEFQTAKQIIQEIFQARPSDVEEMIQMRLEEKNYCKEIGKKMGKYGDRASSWGCYSLQRNILSLSSLKSHRD